MLDCPGWEKSSTYRRNKPKAGFPEKALSLKNLGSFQHFSSWNHAKAFRKSALHNSTHYFFKMGHSRTLFLYFRLYYRWQINFCRWWGLNCGSLVSEAPTLPIEPQPLPSIHYFFALGSKTPLSATKIRPPMENLNHSSTTLTPSRFRLITLRKPLAGNAHLNSEGGSISTADLLVLTG